MKMKTKNPSIKSIWVLSLFTLLFTFACTDDGLETVDPGDPDGGNPGISDNPVVRLNSGGDEIGYGDIVFTADRFFDQEGQAFSNTSVTEVGNTDMDDIYVTERISNADLGSFSYNIPITNGTYNVNLHFAEIYWGAPDGGAEGANNRVFDITIEGDVMLSGLDIYAEVGAVTALIKTYEVTVEDEELNISFAASTDRPKLSALEVLGDGEVLTSNTN